MKEQLYAWYRRQRRWFIQHKLTICFMLYTIMIFGAGLHFGANSGYSRGVASCYNPLPNVWMGMIEFPHTDSSTYMLYTGEIRPAGLRDTLYLVSSIQMDSTSADNTLAHAIWALSSITPDSVNFTGALLYIPLDSLYVR